MKKTNGIDMDSLGVKHIELNFDGRKLIAEGKNVEYTTRKLSQMVPVLLDAEAASDNGNKDTYFMYRAAGVFKNQGLFDSHTMRYDVTVIPSMGIGRELNKTLGHYHPPAPQGPSYPELYEVIRGKAIILMQKMLPDGGIDVLLFNASDGDRVLVLPDYGHITINSGTEDLIMANLVNSVFSSDYKPIEAKRGGAVYLLNDGSVLLNKNYEKATITHDAKPARLPFLDSYKSIYDAFIEMPDKFEFLNNPSLVDVVSADR